MKYAINQFGQSVFIDNVSNGLLCKCVCAECKKELIAVQGKSENAREWHFRHSVDSDCLGGQETAIHKFAKQVILLNNQIEIPGERVDYTNPQQEIPLDSIIPDVVVENNDSPIYFEIEVRNPVNSIKEQFYKKGKYKSLKIDLSNIAYDISPIALAEIVLNNVENKKKIFWNAEEIETSIQVELVKQDIVFVESIKEFVRQNPILSIIVVVLASLSIRKIFFSKRRRN